MEPYGTGIDGTGIDWTGCELVERVEGKVSGRPVVRGTRVLADTIVEDSELGSALPEIQENYPDLQLATIRSLLAFAASHRASHLARRSFLIRTCPTSCAAC